MLTVYLDQNFWIDLSLAKAGQPKRTGVEDALEMVRHAASAGLAVFPLSSTHYLETHKRRDSRSRQALGEFMQETSQNWRIAPAGPLLEAELEAALRHRFALPRTPPPQVFGRGVAHAFGDDRLELTIDDNSVAQLPPADRNAFRASARRLYELRVIQGPPAGLPPRGVEPPSMEASERWAEGQRVLLQKIIATKPDGDKSYVGRVTVAQEYHTIYRENAHVFERCGVTLDDLLHPDITLDELASFLRAMPIRWTVSEMRRVAFGDRQRSIEPNDLEDLVALAIGSTHCDIVAGEQYWTKVIRRSNAEPRARVVATPLDLVVALAEATAE